jgi:hypothetical protein
LADGKIRVTASSWDDAKVIWQNQVLEVACDRKQVSLVRVESRARCQGFRNCLSLASS